MARNQSKVDVEFKEAFKKAIISMLGFMKRHSKPEIIHHLAPEILGGRWYLRLKTTTTYYPRIVAFYDELLKLEDVRKCLDLMLTKGFPERLEMRIVDNEGKPVQKSRLRTRLLAEIFGRFANNFEKYGFEFIEEESKECTVNWLNTSSPHIGRLLSSLPS
ncbi:MAG: hypothetical protein ACUVTD_06505 [Nitrososphaerales archaeon]